MACCQSRRTRAGVFGKARLVAPAIGCCPLARRGTLIARLEAVPLTRWHLRPRLIVGSATFFDAFDTLSLAFVLPVLIPLWHLTSVQVGWLIAVAYLGQLVGAVLFGALAERFGRIRSAAGATALMSVMSLACAASDSVASLLACRFVQGIGIGGEMPVAAVYINELSRAQGRGRFLLLYESIFPIGLMMAGQIGALVVPTLGWQALFLISGVPGLLIAILVLRLPESPRWLVEKGRFAEAESIIARMEASAGHVPAPVPTSGVDDAPTGDVECAAVTVVSPPLGRGLDAVGLRRILHERADQLAAHAVQLRLRARSR
jgi:MFS transporter, putative metabolite:H+ symporter